MKFFFQLNFFIINFLQDSSLEVTTVHVKCGTQRQEKNSLPSKDIKTLYTASASTTHSGKNSSFNLKIEIVLPLVLLIRLLKSGTQKVDSASLHSKVIKEKLFVSLSTPMPLCLPQELWTTLLNYGMLRLVKSMSLSEVMTQKSYLSISVPKVNYFHS